MKKKRVVLICLVGAALALILCQLIQAIQRRSEPRYEGHPLSYWVTQLAARRHFEDINTADRQKPREPIDHIGPAALPFLMKWIRYERPKWRTRLGNWLRQSRLPFKEQLSSRISEPPSFQLAYGSCVAFTILGKRANPAFDELCRLLNETNSPQTSAAAASALGYLGTNALVPLLIVTTNAQHPARRAAMYGIISLTSVGGLDDSAFHAAPEISIPALTSMLTNRDPTLRGYSVEALGDFGPQASNAIPALTNALADFSPDVRKKAAGALHQIAPVQFTNSHAQ